MRRSNRLLAVLLCPALLAAAAAAGADEAPPSVVSHRALTLEGAKRVADAAAAEARRSGSGGVIAVVDEGGNLVFLQRLDGTFPAGANVSIGKARTAALFKKPTSFFEEVIRNGRTAMVTVEGFTPLQGGVPLESEGQIVGGVGVSGAASAAQDEQVAKAGASALR